MASLGYDSQMRLTPLTVNLGQFSAQVNAETREAWQLGAFSQWDRSTRREHPVPMGPLNPQALIRYSYVLNNPLRYVDPTGHWQVGQLELTPEQAQQWIEVLDAIDNVEFWIDTANLVFTFGMPLASLMDLSIPQIISPEFIMLVTGLGEPEAVVLLAMLTAVPAADMMITMHDCGELQEALLSTHADEYGATISMHQVFNFFTISVSTSHAESTFRTAVIGPVGSALPSLLGTAMLYNKVHRRERYTVYLPYIAR